jgi:hypothetical protein
VSALKQIALTVGLARQVLRSSNGSINWRLVRFDYRVVRGERSNRSRVSSHLRTGKASNQVTSRIARYSIMSTETFFDTNLSWESNLDYELAQELLGHTLTSLEWQQLKDALDDNVYETVMSFQR